MVGLEAWPATPVDGRKSRRRTPTNLGRHSSDNSGDARRRLCVLVCSACKSIRDAISVAPGVGRDGVGIVIPEVIEDKKTARMFLF